MAAEGCGRTETAGSSAASSRSPAERPAARPTGRLAQNTGKRNTGNPSGGPGRAIAHARHDVSRKEAAERDLDAAVGPTASADGGHVSVAVDDLTTGVQASYGGRREYVTASIVKADILATLLYLGQRRGDTTLNADDREQAATMMEDSDNDAASDLWWQAGSAAGVDAANKAFGLRETRGGSGQYWGLTTTTTDDQLRLLRELLTTRSVLSASARDYARGLMSSVEPGQRWGVPAAADAGTGVAVKNGWLPDPSLWVINSIGEITHDGHRMLIAVLSDDNESEDGGISVVQRVAGEAADAVTGDT
ncbi:MAG: serine hydrolase [Nocardiopsaceae bacterium]|nr:serine hydrolase [Nocardiopsaceae bacterium]